MAWLTPLQHSVMVAFLGKIEDIVNEEDPWGLRRVGHHVPQLREPEEKEPFDELYHCGSRDIATGPVHLNAPEAEGSLGYR